MLLDRSGCRLAAGEQEYRVRLPEVTDISGQEGIRLDVELLEEGISEIEVALYPLYIARPEFFPRIEGRVAVAGKGSHRVEIPFGQFAYRQMTGAFLKYLDGISVKVLGGGPLVLKSIAADTMGDFAAGAKGCSKTGETGEWVTYTLLLSNKSPGKMLVNVHQSLYGMECLPTEYEPYVVLEGNESREYTVKVQVTEDIPPGGLEKSRFLLVPEGRGSQGREVLFQTSKRRPHPYLFMKERDWQRRKAAIASRESLRETFRREYVEAADAWEVPTAYQGEDHVYPAYSQNGLFAAAVAWKVTGEDGYLQKAMEFFQGFLEEERGYLATRRSYFVFVESKKEYARGDFKVCRAQSGGWVQEAEFFIRLSMAYDLLYEKFTPGQHRQMERCLRNYMAFASWRLTDGDGNNFQVAESGAGLLAAMVLQDREWIDRFLEGYNGVTDLLSAVLLDDGMYFEQASGYVRLAGELFFDIANAAENFGISLKDRKVPASFDRNILHAPWAMRETWAEDGKPFLGMSFRRFERFTRTARCLKDYFDCTARLLTERGIMFSVNDSNEQSFGKLYQKAYYLYGDSLYRKIGERASEPETLLVREEEEGHEPGRDSQLLSGAGFGILREEGCQAVLKFGVHGGYHGHYDRLSLASFLKDNKTFHNNEYAWYGYDSFLFKMWVQTSMAHNMTVVDGRMQKPSPCECIYFAVGEAVEANGPERSTERFSAVCAQTMTEWMDPPYGGQTPYPLGFPEEKCEKEGRFILMPERAREQGAIGDFSEPVFQRRLLILFHGYCVVWDYLEGQGEHRYDCLYHPVGRFEWKEGIAFSRRERFSEDPFGAGQFIQNCYTAQMAGTVCLQFQEAQPRVNGNDILDNLPETALWRIWPRCGEVTIGRYPQRGDTFTEENRKAAARYLEEPLKKTVSFSQRGRSAEFITLLEAGEATGQVRGISCESFQSILIQEADGKAWRFTVTGMEEAAGRIAVSALFYNDVGK